MSIERLLIFMVIVAATIAVLTIGLAAISAAIGAMIDK